MQIEIRASLGNIGDNRIGYIEINDKELVGVNPNGFLLKELNYFLTK